MKAYDKNLNIKKGIPLGFIILATFILITSSGCRSDSPPPEKKHPVAVRIIKPMITDLNDRLSYLGTIHSQKEVKIIARVQGTVTELPFREGQQVSQGEKIAQIEAPELQAVVDRLQVEKEYWCRRYESDRRLVAAKALPEEQMETSKRACLSARAALSEAKSRLAKSLERSPFSGEVLKWFVEPGQSVMPGQPLLLLGDDNIEIQVEVLEEDLRRGLTVGTPVIVHHPDGTELETRIKEIAPQSFGLSRAFLVKIEVPPSYGKVWRKGESVKLDFILKSVHAAVAVPIDAIADRAENPHIFLIREERAILQKVKLGIQQGNLVQVDFPYNGQDFVAITNLERLKDGEPVYTVFAGEELR